MLEKLRLFLRKLLGLQSAAKPTETLFSHQATTTDALEGSGKAPAKFNYPVIERGSKIGIHSTRSKNCLAHINSLKSRGGRMPVVKSVNDIDWLIEVKQIDAQIITIARLNTEDEGLQQIEFETDMQKRVDYLFAPILTKLQLNPNLRDAIDYWEICNEPDPPHLPDQGIFGYTKLSECMIACMAYADSIGLKLAIFALNAGTPEWVEMQAMVVTGVFAHAVKGGHIMTLHEGQFKDGSTGEWPDPVDHLYPSALPEPDAPNIPDAGALVFRYRYLYHLLEQRNEVIPLVVSEIVYGGGYAQDGGSPEDTTARASWYDNQAANDYYIWAHLPFSLGSWNQEWDEWRFRDYEFAYPMLVDYMASVVNRENETAPTVEPHQIFMPIIAGASNPKPEKPAPKPKNKSVVVNLLPPDLKVSEFNTIIQASLPALEGLMHSADDARSLMQASEAGSYVRLWWPARWSGDIISWLNTAGVTVKLAPGGAMTEAKPVATPTLLTHKVSVHLLPKDTTSAELQKVMTVAGEKGEGILFSAETALSLFKLSTQKGTVHIWYSARWSSDIHDTFRSNNINTQSHS